MRTMIKSVPVLALFLAGTMMRSQDFHLTQYDGASLNVNPAMTGLFEGYYRVHAHYRTQWSAIAHHPFQTFAGSFDMPLGKFAAGGQLMDYRAGTGNYNVFSFLASGSYDLILDKEKEYHHISMGAQLGFIQKSIQFSKLTWDEQYSYSNGGYFDTSIPSGETMGDEGIFMPDLNAGFIYYYAKDAVRVNPFFGYSVRHLTRPKESFYGTDNRLPIHHTFHGGVRFSINDKLQLLPKFLLLRQTNAREFTFSVHGHYYLKEQDVFLIFGPTFRLSGPVTAKENFYHSEDDAIVMEMGLKMGPWIYRLSYDINTSSLNPYTNHRGGLELSVTYTGRRTGPQRANNCPRL
ncbi:MAG: PorP/SprF family type IX secretion system membrane protein [Bacteroidia bacterium]|nr:PorP/SprF family type IX secretion system membrane protein [Bacteroidia bacterium]